MPLLQLFSVFIRGVDFGTLYYDGNLLRENSSLHSAIVRSGGSAAWRLTSYRAGKSLSLMLPVTKGA